MKYLISKEKFLYKYHKNYKFIFLKHCNIASSSTDCIIGWFHVRGLVTIFTHYIYINWSGNYIALAFKMITCWFNIRLAQQTSPSLHNWQGTWVHKWVGEGKVHRGKGDGHRPPEKLAPRKVRSLPQPLPLLPSDLKMLGDDLYLYTYIFIVSDTDTLNRCQMPFGKKYVH